MRICELTYFAHPEFNDPFLVLERHRLALGYIPFLKNHADIEVIKHMSKEVSMTEAGVKYSFFKSANSFYYIPFKTHRYIKSYRPDIILIHGFGFPLQVIFLGMTLGSGSKIILLHHGEVPLNGFKKNLQKIANRFISGYFFTALGNAKEWLLQELIQPTKCHEVLAASTSITAGNKYECRKILGIDDAIVFLWVGRLEKNKDPITVLKGLETIIQNKTGISLYMIYQEEPLINEVEQLILSNPVLQDTVHLVGKVPHEELWRWYSAADYFISGSHRESAGYALVEAIACGLIPVIPSIPSFKKIAGEKGIYYTPGNKDSLAEALNQCSFIPDESKTTEMKAYFQENLSYSRIADDTYEICKLLLK